MAMSAFGKAFSEARKAGEKTFEFQGKTYTTRTAEEEAGEKKSRSDSSMRKKSDDVVALGRAERNMPTETTPEARAALFAMRKKAESDYANADNEENMRSYVPRFNPAGAAPKMTPGARGPRPFQSLVPEEDYTNMKKGGKVSASSRGDGIAQRGKTKGTIVMCGGGMARGR